MNADKLNQNSNDENQNLDSRIVESLNPTLIVAGNDEKVQEGLAVNVQENIAQVTQNQEENLRVMNTNRYQQLEIVGNSTTSDDWQANYTSVAIDDSMKNISEDAGALSVLKDQAFAQQLLAGKAIVYQSISTDALGKPKAFNGLKMLQLTRDIKTNQPTISLKTARTFQFPELTNSEPNIKVNREINAKLDYDTSSLIGAKLIEKGINKELDKDKDLILLYALSDKPEDQDTLKGVDAYYAINAIQRIGHKYFKNDIQRNKFFEELEKENIIKLSKDKTLIIDGVEVDKQSEGFKLEDVPTKYKGVLLNPKQTYNLIKGLPVSIEGLKDDKVNGLYSATVKLDVTKGKTIEANPKADEKLDVSIGNNQLIEKVINKKVELETPQINASLGM